MIYLRLFLQFLKIGTVAFGGGYGMLAVIEDTVQREGWLSTEQMVDFVAISESTPGPLAVNLATFIGAEKGGVFGSIAATAGVVLPAFLIMLFIVALAKNLLKYPVVGALLGGIRPVVVGLIFSVAASLGLSVLLNIDTLQSRPKVNLRSWIILVLLLAVHFIFKRKAKKVSPILMIVFSALLGILFYSF